MYHLSADAGSPTTGILGRGQRFYHGCQGVCHGGSLSGDLDTGTVITGICRAIVAYWSMRTVKVPLRTIAHHLSAPHEGLQVRRGLAEGRGGRPRGLLQPP